jgi:hypothetical protein
MLLVGNVPLLQISNIQSRRRDEIFCEDRRGELRRHWEEAEGAHYRHSPRVSDDGRGCDMANAAVELAENNHPARRVIEEFKSAQRERLAKLCCEAQIVEADVLADALSLLLEGARVSRQSSGAAGPCARFAAIGEALIMSFSRAKTPRPPPVSRRDGRTGKPKRRA